VIEGVYSRIWYMRKKEKLEKYKGSSGKIWEETKYGSKKIWI